MKNNIDYEQWQKDCELVERTAHKLGYKEWHNHFMYGTFAGKETDVNFEVTVIYCDSKVSVEIDMEDWDRIPNREYLQDIIDAFDYAEKIGNEVLEAIAKEELK